MSKAAVVLLTLFAAQPVFAQTLSTRPPAARFGALRQEGDPYRKLFEPQPQVKKLEEAAKPKKTIVCGMTMIEGDPAIDPKFVLPPKPDGVDYKMRAISPPTCK